MLQLMIAVLGANPLEWIGTPNGFFRSYLVALLVLLPCLGGALALVDWQMHSGKLQAGAVLLAISSTFVLQVVEEQLFVQVLSPRIEPLRGEPATETFVIAKPFPPLATQEVQPYLPGGRYELSTPPLQLRERYLELSPAATYSTIVIHFILVTCLIASLLLLTISGAWAAVLFVRRRQGK